MSQNQELKDLYKAYAIKHKAFEKAEASIKRVGLLARLMSITFCLVPFGLTMQFYVGPNSKTLIAATLGFLVCYLTYHHHLVKMLKHYAGQKLDNLSIILVRETRTLELQLVQVLRDSLSSNIEEFLKWDVLPEGKAQGYRELLLSSTTVIDKAAFLVEDISVYSQIRQLQKVV